jgi:hypothetical protein
VTPSLAHREGAVSVGGGQVLGHLRIYSQILNRENSVLYRIRIRDPVLFLPLNPGSHIRDGKKSRSGINIPDYISDSIVRGTIFG